MPDYIMRTGTYAFITGTSSSNKDVCMLPSRWRVGSLEKRCYQTVNKKPLVSIIIFKKYDDYKILSTMVESVG